MAKPPPLGPIVNLVAVVISLPFFDYAWHKLLHILGAVLFLGNVIVTAAWMTWAVRPKDAAVAAFASATVNKADQYFTSTGMILLLLNGLALSAALTGSWSGFLNTRWILAGLALLIATGIVYGAGLRRYQNKMVRMSAEAAQAGAALPDEFFAVVRKWNVLGTLATILPLVALYFMVAKPALGG